MENPIFGTCLCGCFVLLCMCRRWEDTTGKGVSFGRVISPHLQPFFAQSAQWRNALGGVGTVGRGGKRRPPRVISFHLALSFGLTRQAPTYTHIHTVHNACIFTQNPSSSCWHPHRCCHTLELESRRGGRGGASDLKTREREREQESKRGRGRERGQCQQLSSQHSQLKSRAQLRSSERGSRQNAAASAGNRHQTQQWHGIRPRNTNSKRQKEGSKARGCRNALRFSCNFALLKGS